MIPIGIKNLTANTLYVKELQVEVSGNQTFFLGTYDFFDLAAAESLKDFINAGSAVIIRDGVQLSQADSLAYVTTPPTGGGGETNTASNVGTGAGQVFKQKTGVDLEFKTIKAGTNITVTNNADDITIDAAGGAGEVNTASNIGTGTDVFKQKTGVDLEFRKINSTELSVTQNTNDITLSAAAALISGQSSVTPAAGMEVLINDSGALKKGDVLTFVNPTVKNKYIDNALVNPTAFVWGNTISSLGANRMIGLLWQLNQKIPIDGLTINKGTTNGGNMTAAIYKYNESTNLFDKIANTEVNTFNTGISGFQTVSITATTLEQGIYMNVMHADTAHGSFGGLQQPKLDPPLGRDAAGAIITGLIRYSYTYAHPMPTSIAPDASFGWTLTTSFFQKYASFLLNQV